MTIKFPALTTDRLRKLGIVATVTLAHLGAFAVMGRAGPPVVDVVPAPPISVELFRPTPPPPLPPPPPPKPSPVAGGGAPAAPSRVHLTRNPPPKPAELVAPIVPAPKPDPILVGAAPISSGAPGMGQGGQGAGTGTGSGDGDGPGSGGARPLILRGATQAEIFEATPPSFRRVRRPPGRGVINCVIRIDQRLDDCRIVEESQPGFGFGEQALRAAGFFRYRPPLTATGRPVEGQRVTVFIDVGRR